MHHRRMYTYINFSKSVLVDQSKPCTQIYLQKNRINLQLAIRILKKSRLSDMHYPLTDIQVDFEINRPVRYQMTVKRNYFHRRLTDRRTDGRTNVQTSRTTTIGSFFRKKNTKSIDLFTLRPGMK